MIVRALQIFTIAILLTAPPTAAQTEGTFEYHYSRYMTAFGSGQLEDAWESVRWLLDHNPFYPNEDDTNYRWAMQILLALVETADPATAAEYRDRIVDLLAEAKAKSEEIGLAIDTAWWEQAAHRMDTARVDEGPLSEMRQSDTLLASVSATGQLGSTVFTSDGAWEVHWSAHRRRFDIVVTPQDSDQTTAVHYVLTEADSPDDGAVCVSDDGRFALSMHATNYAEESGEWNVIVLRSKQGGMSQRDDCLPLDSFPRL